MVKNNEITVNDFIIKTMKNNGIDYIIHPLKGSNSIPF